MRKYAFLAAVAPAMSLSMAVQSAELNWSGFLSVVGGMTLDEDTTYDVGYLGYAGVYDDSFAFEPDTLVALQGQAIVSDKLRATVQLVGRGGQDFDIDAEWAYLSYDLTDNLTLNAGRYRLPAYYYSDFLDLGLAYHWVRAPTSVYDGPSTIDGFNLLYQNYFGDYEFSAQYFTGTIGDRLTESVVNVAFPTNNGLNIQVAKDWWKVRVVYSALELEVSPAIPGLFPSTEGDGEFLGGTFIADYNNALFQVEYTAFYQEEVGSNDDRWYATFAYRFGNVTPHVTYEYSDNPEEEIISAGVAWNFNSSAVLKAQLNDIDQSGAGLDDVQLISFGIDLVF